MPFGRATGTGIVESLPAYHNGVEIPMTRRTFLSLEALDGRDVPSVLFAKAAPPPRGTQAAPDAAAPNQPPVISNFKAVVGPNGQVTFSGVVSDDQAVAGYVVRITGDGVDLSATVRADGTFQVTGVVTGSTDVTVVAQVTDSQGATSDPAYTTFTPSA